jgi:hypothetical protein
MVVGLRTPDFKRWETAQFIYHQRRRDPICMGSGNTPAFGGGHVEARESHNQRTGRRQA